MRKTNRRKISRIAGTACVTWLGLLPACSTTEIAPAPVSMVQPPAYIQAPHPAGGSESDLRAIFFDKKAPAAAALKDCGDAYAKLLAATPSLEERRLGLQELVKGEPLKYHWCFYSGIRGLHERLANSDYIDDKQKQVLDAFGFLGPVARAFMAEFRDSRYLRWAVRDYRRLSEYVFYRRLDATPQLTSELVEATNPFGAWHEVGTGATSPNNETRTVLEKYGLSSSREPAQQASPPPSLPPPMTEPAIEPAAEPAVEPVIEASAEPSAPPLEAPPLAEPAMPGSQAVEPEITFPGLPPIPDGRP
jgi:hypothetical protein